MNRNHTSKSDLSRRDFIKTTAIGVGATALTGVGSKEAQAEVVNWDKEADVVIVGFGGAGCSAAITAHDAGAEVLIIEKAPKEDAGGNSRVAMQLWLCPYPVEDAITYFNALSGLYRDAVPQEMVRVWAEEMGKNTDWFASLGGTPVEYKQSMNPEFPELPGSSSGHVFLNGPAAGGSKWYNVLKSSVEARNIEVLFETPAKELIQDPKSKVILGVKVESGGWSRYIKARKAVIMTLGGFENNRQMHLDYLTNMPYCYPWGTPYNTGDGHKMAFSVGADFWHMMNLAAPYPGFKRPDLDYTTWVAMPANNYIFVGMVGTRFVNENDPIRHGKILRYGQWVPFPTPEPMYYIFDETVRKRGRLPYNLGMSWGSIVHPDAYGSWSADNSAEIEKGWIIKADTIADLASKINLAPATLEKTVSTYNSSCQAGVDAEFGRPATTLKPVETPPYYAMPLTPWFINTQGGPRRNEKAQILRPDGTPIPRLYSAGEFGSIYAFCYNGGGNIGECMAFGRVAGRNASAEEPWS
jgi:succinate dehydrogenase/fumarate reductase flavoprotein subunit